MAARLSFPSFSSISHLLPFFLPPAPSIVTFTSPRLSHLFSRPLLTTPALVLPASLVPSLPSFLSEIWESVLRAVPKKKTSHRKKRQRFLAGKALKDNNSLNSCPACGRVKKAHVLCPHCVADIRDMWEAVEEPLEIPEMERKGLKGKT